MNRNLIANKIITERERHFDLPGSEFDLKNTPNDWIAIISHYLTEEVRRGQILPNKQSFEDNLIKSAAVIMATLEHLDVMEKNKCFQQ